MLASRGEINVDGLKFDGRSFSASVAALSGSLYQREPNVEKCLFIFELLWKMKTAADRVRGELQPIG